MRRRSAAVAATLLSSTLVVGAVVPVAAQEPGPVGTGADAASAVRGEDPRALATEVPDVEPASDGLAEVASAAVGDARRPVDDGPVASVDEDPDDASLDYGLIAYHEIPDLLNDLRDSDRVSVETIGTSTSGRDLHLVAITTPMDDAGWDEWERLADLRTADPTAAIAAFEDGDYDDWKVPVLVNNNIHGNEWEGTDATFQVMEELASSDDPDVVAYLEDHLLLFVPTMNPDGRVAATRANAAGFDMNRDWVTQSQPEVVAVRDQIIRFDPVSLLDMHGYVSPTLIEPTTGPHGQNYEYDLYLRHALPAALAMEEAVLALDEPLAVGPDGDLVPSEAIAIPYRDYTDGWDDWPPIYTPMYAMNHGVVGHTVEIPLNPRGTNLTEEERLERSRINTAVGRASIEANLAYVHDTREDYLADQLELYRRGVAGEDTRGEIGDPALEALAAPANDSGTDNTLVYPQTFPDAWVVPVGDGQRSDTSARRVARFLVDNDVDVLEATTDVTLGGTTYPAGSFVVDMAQAKRGLAQSLLEVGRDVSADFPSMYGDAAWSIGALWGADVVAVDDADVGVSGLAPAVVAPSGSAPAGADAYALEVDGLAGVQAVNHVLAGDGEVGRTADGTFVVGVGDATLVDEAVAAFGVTFDEATAAEVAAAEPFTTHTIGVSAAVDEVFALARAGFDVVPVTAAAFNAGDVAFGDLDALYVSAGDLDLTGLDFARSLEYDAWLADGHAVVGRGSTGLAFNASSLLLEVGGDSAAAGTRDGIAAVVNDPTSPVTGDALEVAYFRNAIWFTGLGDGVAVDQSFADEDGFVLAGHWPEQAAGQGQPVVVSGEARGAYVTLFGTDPLRRSHPEGTFRQVAEALWMPPADADDPGPGPGPVPIPPCDAVVGPRFPDVPGDGPHGGNIGCVAGYGIAQGHADGTYRPANPVRRDQMTSFLARLLTVAGVELPEAPRDRFADDDGGTHELATDQLAQLGIVQGRADGRFDPSGSVTRAQMASFLVRSLETILDRDLTADDGPFTDTAGSPHTANIDVAAELGIARGRTPTTFEPQRDVRRDQMASFLARTLEVLVDEGVELTPLR